MNFSNCGDVQFYYKSDELKFVCNEIQCDVDETGRDFIFWIALW